MNLKIKWFGVVGLAVSLFSGLSIAEESGVFKVDLTEIGVRAKLAVLTLDDIVVGETAYVDHLGFCLDERDNVRLYKGQKIINTRDRVKGLLTKVKLLPNEKFEVFVVHPKGMDEVTYAEKSVDLYRGMYVSCNYNKSRGVLPYHLIAINGYSSLSELLTKPVPKEGD